MADEQNRIRAIPLPANSFELRDLDKAIGHAVGVKDESTHAERVSTAIRSEAKLPEVLEGFEQPALPEGTEIADVETQAGQKVRAPISKPAEKAKDGTEAAAAEIPSTAETRETASAGGAQAVDENQTAGRRGRSTAE